MLCLQAKLRKWNHFTIKPIAVTLWKLEEDGLYLKLDHSQAFRHLLTAVDQQKNKYGSGHCHQGVLVNTVSVTQCENLKEIQLAHLRSLVLAEHVMALLKTNG